MKILYIGYWGANEGLSQATIMPHLEILCDFIEVNKVVYASVERGFDTDFTIPLNEKIKHLPLRANRTKSRLINKIHETIRFGNDLMKLAKREEIDLVICRTSLAGNWGLKIHRKLKIPFVVESFEPHATYMKEQGTWKPWGLSYQFQHRKEEGQKKEAFAIFPVAENYKQKLIAEGIDPIKITTVPCAVDIEKFQFDEKKRVAIRKLLGLSDNTITAIYVGKFDGIYYSASQAFKFFKAAHNHFKNFHLILLTPTESEALQKSAKENDYPLADLTISLVAHSEVPDYLSASDFAFSLHYPIPSMKYVSPIKNGEYWANGLPVIISAGIGDDSEIISESGFGWVFDVNSVEQQFPTNLKDLRSKEIIQLATDFRSFQNVKSAYTRLINLL